MFKNNKYTKYYNNIIKTAKNRILEEHIYFEKHHIIPKSLGGSNKKENIVKLTAKEHFICHRLLVKMTDGKNKIKMSYALRCMMNQENQHQSRYKINGKYYEKIIMETRKILSENSKGENNSFFGKKHSDETKNKLSKLRTERSELGLIEGMMNKNHNEETKQKLRKSAIEQFSNESNREIQRKKALEQFKDSNQRYKAGNGKRGKKWYYNPETLHTSMFYKNNEPEGYIIGSGKKGIKLGPRGPNGKKWYYNPETLHSVMCSEQDKPDRYILGRIIKKEKEVVA